MKMTKLPTKGKTVSVTEAIKNRYGSKKGLLRYVAYELLRMFGVYRSLSKIDFAQVKRLVFVCHGNICRSPLGEAVARQQDVAAISFGLDTRGNAPADPRAIAWAQANGYNLQEHITKRVDQYEPQAGDLLIGMEPKHIHKLQEKFAQAPVQITLIGLWLRSPLAYLHDPYNSSAQYFAQCETLVDLAVQSIIKRWKKMK
jgi:protein-tyrosine phosphatase